MMNLPFVKDLPKLPTAPELPNAGELTTYTYFIDFGQIEMMKANAKAHLCNK